MHAVQRFLKRASVPRTINPATITTLATSGCLKHNAARTMKDAVRVPRHVVEASSVVMYVTRILGVAPCALRTMHKTKTHYLQQSARWTVYGFAVCTLIVYTSLSGVVNDLTVRPLSRSIRMQNGTSKVVTCCDIFVIVLAAGLAVFGAPLRVRSVQRIVALLNEVDAPLALNDARPTRKRSIAVMVGLFATATTIMVVDFLAWRHKLIASDKLSALYRNYTVFYLLYYIIIGLECQYWHLVYCLTRRFKRLNELLRTKSDRVGLVLHAKDEFLLPVVENPVGIRFVGNAIDCITWGKRLAVTGKRDVEAVDHFRTLRVIHGKLCDCIVIVNDSYGLVNLVIISSCMLHLIVTPYFLLLELANPNDVLFIVVQATWILAHMARLMIVVLPCYSTIYESKNTGPSISKLLCTDLGKELRKELKLFSLQVLHRKVEFTACGLINVNRKLLTTISGAVTTYLVILVQFQHQDRNDDPT